MSKKIKNLIIVSGLTFGLVLFLMPIVKAATLRDAFSGQLSTVGSRSGFNTSQRSVDPIIGTIISVILSFLGVIFLILMVYGGYTWMMAAGNDEKVTKAKSLIKAAIIGLLIVVGAYAITIFVMARISKDLIPETGGISSGGSYDPIKEGLGTDTNGDGSTLGCCQLNDGTCEDNVDSPTCTKKAGFKGWSSPIGGCSQIPECSGGFVGCCVDNRPSPQSPSCMDVTDKNVCIGAVPGFSPLPCSKTKGCDQYDGPSEAKAGCCAYRGYPRSCAMTDTEEICKQKGGLASFNLGKSCDEVSDCTWGCCFVDNFSLGTPECYDLASNQACLDKNPQGVFHKLNLCVDVTGCP